MKELMKKPSWNHNKSLPCVHDYLQYFGTCCWSWQHFPFLRLRVLLTVWWCHMQWCWC